MRAICLSQVLCSSFCSPSSWQVTGLPDFRESAHLQKNDPHLQHAGSIFVNFGIEWAKPVQWFAVSCHMFCCKHYQLSSDFVLGEQLCYAGCWYPVCSVSFRPPIAHTERVATIEQGRGVCQMLIGLALWGHRMTVDKCNYVRWLHSLCPCPCLAIPVFFE